MITNFSEVSFTDNPKIFFVNGDGYANFPLIAVGNKSYVVSAVIETLLNPESNSLIIGSYCSIAHNVSFLINLNHDYNYVSTYPLVNMYPDWKCEKLNLNKGQIVIGNDVWIGRAATILDGVTIGNGAIVAANSVVSKSVPPYAIVAGNPAKIVKYRFNEDIIQKLNTIKWWYWNQRKMLENKEFFTTNSLKEIDLLYQEVIEYNRNKQLNQNLEFNEFESKYFFVPDFDSPYPIWKKVVAEFVDKFSIIHNATLILWIPNIDFYAAQVDIISNIVNSKANAPIIFIENNESFSDEFVLLKKVNFFISNRDIKSLKLIDYACDYGISFISGMKCPLF